MFRTNIVDKNETRVMSYAFLAFLTDFEIMRGLL
jgi:hypothetical protein